MAVQTAPSRLRSALVGGGIAIVGALIALGVLGVIARVDGDLLATLPLRRGALVPAWVMVAILILVGALVFAAGLWVTWIGWRAAGAARAAEHAAGDYQGVPEDQSPDS